jgi:hypothetical protein
MVLNRETLESLGFVGFQSVADLRAWGCTPIPADAAGVYVVLAPSGMSATFLSHNPGGWFKGKDPTVGVDVLHSRWVPDTPVVYIGRASQTHRTNLHKRVRKFLDFGVGKPVGHWGGRLIWQVADADWFIIAWKPCADFKKIEAQLLDDFERQHCCLPFANLRRESGD